MNIFIKMKNKPLVSVLIANYNNAKYLTKCIDSVLSQNYERVEVIIIDDKSTDNSLDVIKKYQKKIKVIKNKKKKSIGSYNQINTYFLGFKKSKGEIIFFLDSDDYFSKKKILTIIKYFNLYKDSKVIFDLPILKFNNKKLKKKFKQKLFLLSSWPRFSPQSCISIRKIYGKEVFRSLKIKKFNLIWFDFRIAIYTFLKFKKLIILQKYLTYYRQNSYTASKKFKTFSKNWWLRRSEAHDFFSYVAKKLKIKDKFTIDKLVTIIFKKVIYLK